MVWKCVLSNATTATTFAITDTKLYVLVVTLSAQDNAKLLGQSRSSFKRTNDWNKYQSKVWTERQNQYLDFLIDPTFHGVNILFILSFENEKDRYDSCNVMIDRKNFFDQPVQVIWEHIVTFEKLQQVKEMVI